VEGRKKGKGGEKKIEKAMSLGFIIKTLNLKKMDGKEETSHVIRT
jgi:hypothetical protein